MLSIPLSQLKRDLEEMLLDLQLLAAALKQLRDLLPEHAEKRVTVLTLLGRLNDANKKALRGTLDNTALQTEYNAIRADLSDFVQALEEGDFDENAAASAKATAAKATKQGNVLYRIPHSMPLREETECTVRIALSEDAIVEEITLDAQVVLKSLSRVTDLMQVEIGDPAREPVFAIRSTSPPQQLITDEGFTEWFFYVEPLRVGTHPLEVKVSVLELAFNQVHRKELVFRETIEIYTEGAAAAEDDAEVAPPSSPSPPSVVGFKSAGTAFAFGNSTKETGGYEVGINESVISDIPVIEPKEAPLEKPSGNSGLRTLALFMGFILLGSSATWAFTPAETRDWWVASIIRDDAPAYATYIQKHPDSPYREKAFFYRAERSQQLADLRAYQREYRQGQFQDKITAGIASLETKAIDSIRTRPSRDNISRFAAEFPESERLADVKQAVESHADLLKEVESAYVASARTKPTAQKVRAYLSDFPQHERLGEVAEAVAAKPEVMAKVQGELEDAFLQKMEQDPTPKQAEEFLNQFPEPVKKEQFEKILEKKPAVRKEAVKQMKRIDEIKKANAVEQQKKRIGDNRQGSVNEKNFRRSGLEVVRVEGGVFTMGSPESEAGRSEDECQHQVEVRPFYIGSYEITQADWFEIMGTRPSYFHKVIPCDECPVEQVSWNDVQVFLKKLNSKSPGKKYRLPSEEEWEYAARGGNKSQHYIYSGSNDLSKVGWNVDNSDDETHRVGYLAANEIGLYDMSGNVFEWCMDKYGPFLNCSGKEGTLRVFRGGSFNHKTRSLRDAFRNAGEPTRRAISLGFRIAMSV